MYQPKGSDLNNYDKDTHPNNSCGKSRIKQQKDNDRNSKNEDTCLNNGSS